MAQQTHQSDPRVLNRRTLAQDHRTLAKLLQAGMQVLDVGCGTGAITAGIAEAVGQAGSVVGIDRDASLVEIARKNHLHFTNLSFEQRDVLALTDDAKFDIVTAARALQWISNPFRALVRMAAATKRGGMIVVLDYNHEDNSWDPSPPWEFVRFYNAFLAWRAANQWDNRIADHLPSMFASAGLGQIEDHDDREVSSRGEPNFESATAIWPHVMETIGLSIVVAGFLSEMDREQAKDRYEHYRKTTLATQCLAIKTITGSRQSPGCELRPFRPFPG